MIILGTHKTGISSKRTSSNYIDIICTCYFREFKTGQLCVLRVIIYVMNNNKMFIT